MKTLIVAAHPDDEVYGATSAKEFSDGEVDVIFVADGVSSRLVKVGGLSREAATLTAGVEIPSKSTWYPRQEKLDAEQARWAQAQNVAHYLGFDTLEFIGLEDQWLSNRSLLHIQKVVEKRLDEHAYDRVITHWDGDTNQDHVIVSKAVQVATRRFRGCVLMMEVIGSTPGFKPNYYAPVDIPSKLEALHRYGETEPQPHPRSFEAVEALAVLRGSESGMLEAEAFMVHRIVT